jgi:transcription factor TGA
VQQAEEVLTQGLEQLHQSLAVMVSGSGCLADNANDRSFMGVIAVALGKLSNLEGAIQVTQDVLLLFSLDNYIGVQITAARLYAHLL